MPWPWWSYVIVPGVAALWVLLEMWLRKHKAKDVEEEGSDCSGCGLG